MSLTTAVPIEVLAAANPSATSGQPLCPSCRLGYLHPYLIEIALGGWSGVQAVTGWVAVCVGDADYDAAMARLREEAGVLPVGEVVGSRSCGFTMALQPRPVRRFPVLGRA